jgi:hypothetical protein
MLSVSASWAGAVHGAKAIASVTAAAARRRWKCLIGLLLLLGRSGSRLTGWSMIAQREKLRQAAA